MRCSCGACGTYMVHAESMDLGCVCPECGARCRACLGTDTVLSRDALKAMKDDPNVLNWMLSPPTEPTGATRRDEEDEWTD